jgi:hypothetical protein
VLFDTGERVELHYTLLSGRVAMCRGPAGPAAAAAAAGGGRVGAAAELGAGDLVGGAADEQKRSCSAVCLCECELLALPMVCRRCAAALLRRGLRCLPCSVAVVRGRMGGVPALAPLSSI